MEIGHTLHEMGHAIKCATTGCRAGDERLTYSKINAPESISVSSNAFMPGEPISAKYSQDGENISPPLSWKLPAEGGVESVALIVEDPDAPTPEPYVHWMVYNIRPGEKALPEGYMGMGGPAEGQNSTMHVGYVGMAPPKGDVAHHYHFQVYALDKALSLIPGAGRNALLNAIKGHVLGKGQLVGTFAR